MCPTGPLSPGNPQGTNLENPVGFSFFPQAVKLQHSATLIPGVIPSLTGIGNEMALQKHNKARSRQNAGLAGVFIPPVSFLPAVSSAFGFWREDLHRSRGRELKGKGGDPPVKPGACNCPSQQAKDSRWGWGSFVLVPPAPPRWLGRGQLQTEPGGFLEGRERVDLTQGHEYFCQQTWQGMLGGGWEEHSFFATYPEIYFLGRNRE